MGKVKTWIDRAVPERIQKILLKSIPIVGPIVTVTSFRSDVKTKGLMGAIGNAALDEIPVVEYTKGGLEVYLDGDLVPDRGKKSSIHNLPERWQKTPQKNSSSH
ncbi:hypothetical protein [Candidatus Albibeggiatoa sp. nov. NOAA]|uniref:hypothetical protein n=1 Tax=Candidatus Albibeggiatoa sp. nov. NOAA TaxID=3162724 RepID=UPI00330015F6|nr:hypothetical protein [Thiotrichaceae bacterium]